MKKPFSCGILMMLFVLVQALDLKADIDNFSLFKVANYHQTNGTQPLTLDFPNAYYFGAQLGSDTNDYFGDTNDVTLTNAFFYTPNGTQYFMSTSDFIYYSYGSPFFASQADLDSAFTNGDYEFDVNSGADEGDLIVPSNSLYCADIPYFTGDTWTNMQMVDASKPFTLAWNNFDPATGTSDGYNFTFLIMFDPTGFSPYRADLIPPDVLSNEIPANTLAPGTTYTLQIIFSDRISETNAGFASGAPGIVGFDNRTYTSLVTLPLPSLTITQAGTNVVLSWPTTPGGYVLQTTTELPPANGWTTVNESPSIINNQYLLTTAIVGNAAFYRLANLMPVHTDVGNPITGYTKTTAIVTVKSE